MNVEQENGSKLGFFSKIKRGLAVTSHEPMPEAVESKNLGIEDAIVLPQPTQLAVGVPDFALQDVAPIVQETIPDQVEELVITCEGMAGPQIRRTRGHGPTITHVNSTKAQSQWLLAEVEAVALAEAPPKAETLSQMEAVALAEVPTESQALPEADALPRADDAPTVATPIAPHPNGSTPESRTISMANNLKESLDELMKIEGAVAVALVDGNSGMAMGTAGGGPLNLEVAAAGNSEVVRSKLKVMKALNLRENIEDILISLSTQYHIIRPLAKDPEIFVYLVLNRSNSNLAMARFKLASVEKQLEI